MRKKIPLKNILILGVLLLILIILVPKWFLLKTQDPVITTDNTQQTENTPTNPQIIKFPEEIITPNIVTQNISNKNNLLVTKTKNKDIPDVWCIAFNSFASYKQAQNFAKKLEDNKFPVFIMDKEKYRLDSVMLSSQIKNEVIIGPEIDREIIEKHLKNLEILGIKGKIIKFKII